MSQHHTTVKHPYKLLLVTIAGTGILVAMASGAGASVSRTKTREVDWLSQLAHDGDNGAQLQLGLAYRDGRYGLKADPHTGLYWLKASASQGNAYAADTLANAYAQGEGVQADPQLAAKWWEAAAQEGNADAQRHLAEFQLAQGQEEEALNWLRQAADRGNATAQADLTRIYRHHPLAAQDLHRGENNVAALSERLDARGLKAMYAVWNTLEENSTEEQSAKRLLTRANAGDPNAEYQLGLHYRDGSWAVRRDPAQAEQWLHRAAAAGNQLAINTLAQKQKP